MKQFHPLSSTGTPRHLWTLPSEHITTSLSLLVPGQQNAPHGFALDTIHSQLPDQSLSAPMGSDPNLSLASNVSGCGCWNKQFQDEGGLSGLLLENSEWSRE